VENQGIGSDGTLRPSLSIVQDFRADLDSIPTLAPSQGSLGYVLGGFEIWKAYLYPPSFRPADTFLPIREKGLTYTQFCIAIQFFEYNNRTYPNEAPHKGQGECRNCKASALLKSRRKTGALQVSPL